jgi:hypothetical protein
MEAIRPIAQLLEAHDTNFGVALGSEPYDHAMAQGSRNMLICNAMMISRRHHPYWEAVFSALLGQIGKIKTADEPLSPVDTTGPVLLTQLYEKQPIVYSDVVVYPPNVFYPVRYALWPVVQHLHALPNTYFFLETTNINISQSTLQDRDSVRLMPYTDGTICEFTTCSPFVSTPPNQTTRTQVVWEA